MGKYDIVVVGSGCGMMIAEEAAERGLKVAALDRAPLLGGTCLNLGCIPSKMLITAADRIMEIRDSAKLGVDARIENIDFTAIMARMRRSRARSQKEIRAGITNFPVHPKYFQLIERKMRPCQSFLTLARNFL